MSEQAFTPVAVIERTPGYQALTRPAKRRVRPELRKRREPSGPCRVCDRAATKFRGHTPLCQLHYQAVAELVNHGETAAVTKAREIAKAERGERGSLRDRLKAKHAASWPDRPITRFIPVAGD